MSYLIYSSYATKPFVDEELKELLIASRQRNLFRSVTGVLFYFDGKFIQLIEGHALNVKLLYANLYNDKRHHTLQLHKESDIDERYFPDWTMAFKPISSDNVAGVDGFNDMRLHNSVNLESVMKLYHVLGDK